MRGPGGRAQKDLGCVCPVPAVVAGPSPAYSVLAGLLHPLRLETALAFVVWVV